MENTILDTNYFWKREKNIILRIDFAENNHRLIYTCANMHIYILNIHANTEVEC